MAEFRSSRPRPRSLPRISATPSSADREAHRRAFAVLLQVPLEEVTDARLDEQIAALRRSAEADADALVVYLDDWVKHFQAIGCPCSQIANYFRLARQTLASLYFAAARPTPSPTEVKLLALRYALDARQGAQGPPDRFLLKRCDQYWEVRAHPEMALPELPYPPQVVRDPFAVRLLDLVFRGRWEPYPLVELIESLLGGNRPAPTRCRRSASRGSRTRSPRISATTPREPMDRSNGGQAAAPPRCACPAESPLRGPRLDLDRSAVLPSAGHLQCLGSLFPDPAGAGEGPSGGGPVADDRAVSLGRTRPPDSGLVDAGVNSSIVGQTRLVGISSSPIFPRQGLARQRLLRLPGGDYRNSRGPAFLRQVILWPSPREPGQEMASAAQVPASGNAPWPWALSRPAWRLIPFDDWPQGGKISMEGKPTFRGGEGIHAGESRPDSLPVSERPAHVLSLPENSDSRETGPRVASPAAAHQPKEKHARAAAAPLDELLGRELVQRYDDALRQEWRPQTPTEDFLVRDLARHQAALERAERIELAVLMQGCSWPRSCCGTATGSRTPARPCWRPRALRKRFRRSPVTAASTSGPTIAPWRPCARQEPWPHP